MTDKTTSDITSYMIGMSLLGKAINGDGAAIIAILDNSSDEQLIKALEYNQKIKLETNADVDPDYSAHKHLENIKKYLRLMIEMAFKETEKPQTAIEKECAAHRQRQAIQKLATEFKNQNKPHPMGTVDQLAKKFNVSKSEIRRRKADNTLNELLLQQTEKA